MTTQQTEDAGLARDQHIKFDILVPLVRKILDKRRREIHSGVIGDESSMYNEAIGAITAQIEKAVAEANGCPCVYTNPCSAYCTCAFNIMSGGCHRCCRYGSIEQRIAAAKRLCTSNNQVSDLPSFDGGIVGNDIALV